MIPDQPDHPPAPATTPRKPFTIPEEPRPSSPRRMMLLGGALLAACAMVAGFTIFFVSLILGSTPVTLIVDGEARLLDTRAGTVRDLLDELDIVVYEGDFIAPALDSKITPDVVVEVNHARDVVLTVDGEMHILRTTFTNPADILDSAGVEVAANDRIMVDGTQADESSLTGWPVMASRIIVVHAVPLYITDGDEHVTIQTTDSTIGEALYNAGFTLYLADAVSPDLNTPVMAELEVTIERAQPITIAADGVTLQSRTQGTTVADALADAGVALMGLDYAIPEETADLLPGMTIRVIRVTEEVVVEQEFVQFETVYQADANLELDQRSLVQDGQQGIMQTRMRVRYENGVEVSRDTEDTVVVQEAVNRIVNYGTAIVLRTIDTPNGPREYWRHIRMYATSYKPIDGDNITGTGEILRYGIVAVVPGVIPYYTEVFVPGYGIGLVADSGGGLPDSDLWIDLGYSEDDYQSWHRYVDVYLLTPVPERINYLLPE